MVVPSFKQFVRAPQLTLVAVATLACWMGGPEATAQRPEGVIFVDDIESQLRKQQARQGHPAASTRPGAPAQRPISNTTARQGLIPTSPPVDRGTAQRPMQYPAPTGLPKEEPKKSWRDRFSFKNPFSKMFASRGEAEAEALAQQQVSAQQPHHRQQQESLQRQQGAPPNSLASGARHPHDSPMAAAPESTSLGATRSTTNPRLQGPVRTAAAEMPGFDPFNATGPPRAQGTANSPLAAGRSTMPRQATPRQLPQEPAGDPVTIEDGGGLVMVSDLDDRMLNQLPSIEGPVQRQPGMPVVDNGRPAQPTVTAPYPVTNIPVEEPAAVARTAGGEESEAEEIVNEHVRLASATQHAAPTRLPPARPQGTISSQRSQHDSARARRGVPAHVPVAVENPVTREAVESRPSAEKAIELLTRASELSKKASSEDQYTQVLQLCRSALAIDDTASVQRYSNELAGWALNRRGEVKMDRGETSEALLDFEDALRLDPQRWRALHNRGVISAQEGRYAEAFDDFNRTLELNPKFAKAFSNRAALYVQAGDFESALDDYQQAIAFDPELAIAHKGRAKVCHLLGDFDGALRHFDAAMLLAPNDATIVNYRGDLLCDIGRYADAARAYRDAMDIDPNLVDAYRNLAWLAATCPNRELRNPEAAMALAGKMMELSPQPGDLEYDTLAAAHAVSGDFAKALELMDKAIELSPPEAKANYEWRRQLYEQHRPYFTEPTGTAEATTQN